MATRNTVDKFHTLYTIDPQTGCWEWQLSLHSSGHGVWRWNGKYETAHRISMRIHGYDLDNKQVNHHCDNPSCVNPKHLYLGTQQDNMRDKQVRGRSDRGTDRWSNRLSEEQVKEIRKDTTSSHASLGRKYGVTYHTIRKIRNKELWSWLD
jgi:hypothetical protein